MIKKEWERERGVPAAPPLPLALPPRPPTLTEHNSNAASSNVVRPGTPIDEDLATYDSSPVPSPLPSPENHGDSNHCQHNHHHMDSAWPVVAREGTQPPSRHTTLGEPPLTMEGENASRISSPSYDNHALFTPQQPRSASLSRQDSLAASYTSLAGPSGCFPLRSGGGVNGQRRDGGVVSYANSETSGCHYAVDDGCTNSSSNHKDVGPCEAAAATATSFSSFTSLLSYSPFPSSLGSSSAGLDANNTNKRNSIGRSTLPSSSSRRASPSSMASAAMMLARARRREAADKSVDTPADTYHHHHYHRDDECEPECNPSPYMLGRTRVNAKRRGNSDESSSHDVQRSPCTSSARDSCAPHHHYPDARRADLEPRPASFDPSGGGGSAAGAVLHGCHRYLLEDAGGKEGGRLRVDLDRNASMERMEDENSRSRSRVEVSVSSAALSLPHSNDEGEKREALLSVSQRRMSENERQFIFLDEPPAWGTLGAGDRQDAAYMSLREERDREGLRASPPPSSLGSAQASARSNNDFFPFASSSSERQRRWRAKRSTDYAIDATSLSGHNRSGRRDMVSPSSLSLSLVEAGDGNDDDDDAWAFEKKSALTSASLLAYRRRRGASPSLARPASEGEQEGDSRVGNPRAWPSPALSAGSSAAAVAAARHHHITDARREHTHLRSLSSSYSVSPLAPRQSSKGLGAVLSVSPLRGRLRRTRNLSTQKSHSTGRRRRGLAGVSPQQQQQQRRRRRSKVFEPVSQPLAGGEVHPFLSLLPERGEEQMVGPCDEKVSGASALCSTLLPASRCPGEWEDGASTSSRPARLGPAADMYTGYDSGVAGVESGTSVDGDGDRSSSGSGSGSSLYEATEDEPQVDAHGLLKEELYLAELADSEAVVQRFVEEQVAQRWPSEDGRGGLAVDGERGAVSQRNVLPSLVENEARSSSPLPTPLSASPPPQLPLMPPSPSSSSSFSPQSGGHVSGHHPRHPHRDPLSSSDSPFCPSPSAATRPTVALRTSDSDGGSDGAKAGGARGQESKRNYSVRFAADQSDDSGGGSGVGQLGFRAADARERGEIALAGQRAEDAESSSLYAFEGYHGRGGGGGGSGCWCPPSTSSAAATLHSSPSMGRDQSPPVRERSLAPGEVLRKW